MSEEKGGTVKKGILILVIILAFISPAFAAEKVSGQFKSSTKGAIKPTAVTAFPTRSVQEPLKWVTSVVVAEGTMNAAEAVQALDPRTALINQQGMQGKNYISFWIRPDGYVGMNATFSEGMVQYIDSTKNTDQPGMTGENLEATFTENSANRVAGRIRTTRPGKTMSGETYELDVEFDTQITRLPAGKKLGAGGGDPGKALMGLFDAMKSNNWKGVQAGVSSKILESDVNPDATDADNLKTVVDSISFLLPKGKNKKILGGEEHADRAVLELQGEMEDGAGNMLYLVQMLKEPSGWRFDRSTMYGFLD
jgi:hypothetical protein